MRDYTGTTFDDWEQAKIDRENDLQELADSINARLSDVYAEIDRLQAIVEKGWAEYASAKDRSRAQVEAIFQRAHADEMDRQRDFDAFVTSLLQVVLTGDEDAVKAMLEERKDS